MMKMKFKILKLTFFIVFFSINIFAGEIITTSLLQYKTGRIYFPYGEENNIFTGCNFILYHNEDSILTSVIENSHPGVSYSYPLNVNIDTININNHNAVISTADIDSINPIVFGILNGDDHIRDEIEVMPTSVSNQFVLKEFETFFEMTIAFENENIDGMVSSKRYLPKTKRIHSFSRQSDFVAVMIPNIGSSVNNRGILTTSLYYRFSTDMLPIYFNGDGIRSYNRLFYDTTTSKRYYQYDPYQGRRLLSVMDPSEKKVGIFPASKNLKRLAEYFGDILVRDKMQFSLDSADVYLTFIPLDRYNPGAALDSIHTILLYDMPDDYPGESTIKTVENFIHLGMTADSISAMMEYFRKAEQILTEDFGVFPLFQPSDHFTLKDNVKGFKLKADGAIDLSGLRRVIIPFSSRGWQR
jgi:hypothetical protein